MPAPSPQGLKSPSRPVFCSGSFVQMKGEASGSRVVHHSPFPAPGWADLDAPITPRASQLPAAPQLRLPHSSSCPTAPAAPQLRLPHGAGCPTGWCWLPPPRRQGTAVGSESQGGEKQLARVPTQCPLSQRFSQAPESASPNPSCLHFPACPGNTDLTRLQQRDSAKELLSRGWPEAAPNQPPRFHLSTVLLRHLPRARD